MLPVACYIAGTLARGSANIQGHLLLNPVLLLSVRGYQYVVYLYHNAAALTETKMCI